MNLSTLKKFSALFAITLVFSSVSFAQLTPILQQGAGESFVQVNSYEGLFKAWKRQQEGGNQAVGTDALRFSFLVKQDLPCIFDNCSNESNNSFGTVYYKSSTSGWNPLFNLNEVGGGDLKINTVENFSQDCYTWSLS